MSLPCRSLDKIFLHPGELAIAVEPTEITTVLGSCVSLVLYSPRLRIGAMCHITMPNGTEIKPGKYADQTIEFLLAEFQRKGIKRRETIVKLFGGADMFSTKDNRRIGTIGAENVRSAIATLNRSGYEPMVTDIGGPQGRKLIFYSDTGEVLRKWVKKELLTF
ncbi:chemotaxis protein CheD [Malonomonas rubra DSM 5091]|uniref:Probable chemoreceptor glutamine deamidase CheD n=1 Tax=Malonomonas rubra DSM 5091 TaxID=1122189 RepID=A0A1M6IRC7_MALRU|nr:chemotaxis protein CheD [Malonomonas rubra]SHJ37056.1 chemotaxis protein CheD [Malonomonas rubra DSM 5091]